MTLIETFETLDNHAIFKQVEKEGGSWITIVETNDKSARIIHGNSQDLALSLVEALLKPDMKNVRLPLTAVLINELTSSEFLCIQDKLFSNKDGEKEN